MNCQICGRACVSGAKLCPDCRAARKRAFDATVTQPLLAAAGAGRASRSSTRLLKPSQSLPDAARRAARQAASSAPQEPSDAASRAKWPFVVAALAVVLLAGGYFTQRLAAAKRAEAATQRAAEETPGEAVPTPPPLKPANAETAQATRSDAASPSTSAAPLPATIPVFQTAPPSLRMDPPRQNARTRPAPPVAAAIVPEPAPAPQPVAVAPPPPSPVVREVPRPDPWQPLNEALARCSRDVLGFAMCEQRVRSQYCNGHWGQVPQCASIPYVDHGQ